MGQTEQWTIPVHANFSVNGTAGSCKSHQQPCLVPWKCKPPLPGSHEFTLCNAICTALLWRLHIRYAWSQNGPTGFVSILWQIFLRKHLSWDGFSLAAVSLQMNWAWRNSTDFTSPVVFWVKSHEDTDLHIDTDKIQILLQRLLCPCLFHVFTRRTFLSFFQKKKLYFCVLLKSYGICWGFGLLFFLPSVC